MIEATREVVQLPEAERIKVPEIAKFGCSIFVCVCVFFFVHFCGFGFASLGFGVLGFRDLRIPDLEFSPLLQVGSSFPGFGGFASSSRPASGSSWA